MENGDMSLLLEQLDKEGKELIAITDHYILVYWWQDKSYVSWTYYWHQSLKRYAFEHGCYLPIDTNVSKNEAIKWFAERINK